MFLEPFNEEISHSFVWLCYRYVLCIFSSCTNFYQISVYQCMGYLVVFYISLVVNIHCIDFDPFPATTYSKCFSRLNYDSSNGINYDLFSIYHIYLIKHCLGGLQVLNNGSVDL